MGLTQVFLYNAERVAWSSFLQEKSRSYVLVRPVQPKIICQKNEIIQLIQELSNKQLLMIPVSLLFFCERKKHLT